MEKLKPDIYQQNIFNINYNKLYKDGIRCLIFDLDNTLAVYNKEICSKDTKELIEKLKKKFIIVMVSNNLKARIKKYEKKLQIETIYFAMKPLTRSFRKIRKKHKLEKSEMIMIGDQLLTDVLAAKRYGIKSCYVEPLSRKDLKITSLIRMIEKKIIKKYEERKIFERGKFYEYTSEEM